MRTTEAERHSAPDDAADLRERVAALERQLRRLDVELGDEESLLNIQAVHALVDLSPREIQRRVDAGTFPSPLRLGSRRVWPKGRVKRWIRRVEQQDRKSVARS